MLIPIVFFGTQTLYEPNGFEKCGDLMILTVNLFDSGNETYKLHLIQRSNTLSHFVLQLVWIWNIVYFTSPIIILILYCRGHFRAKSISKFAIFAAAVAVIVFISFCIRGYGRSTSINYTRFVDALDGAKSNVSSQSAKERLRMFDFEFNAWPVDFNVADLDG